MVAIDKERFKDLCKERGLKIVWVLEQAGLSPVEFQYMNFFQKKGKNLEPYKEVTEDIISSFELVLGCDREEFTFILPTCKK